MTSILLLFLILLELSIESVIISFFIFEFFIFFDASPLKTAWVIKTKTSLAPFFFKASTAFIIVPPLSIISSTIMQVLFLTSPMLALK